MGTACNVAQPSRPSKEDNRVCLYGDWLNQDTRSLHVAMSMSGVPFDYINIDTLKKENLDEDFKKLNPNMTVPIFTRRINGDHEKLLGDEKALFMYAINSFPEVKAKMFNEEQKNKFIGQLGHFQTVVRKNTGWQIRRIIKKKFDEQNPEEELDADADKRQRKVDTYKDAYQNQFLKKYDEALATNRYLTGHELTLIDIMVYCEIETLLRMTKEPIPLHYAYLLGWYDRLSELDEIKFVNEKFSEIVEQEQLFE